MIKFGTGGWRAIIGDDFTYRNVRLLVQAIAEDIKNTKNEHRPVVIGYDSRFLSDTAAKLCAEVLAANDILVYLIDRQTPTPLTMFTVKKYNSMYGLIVTASHNPAEYNGVKLIVEGGRDASVEHTENIEKIIATIKEPIYMNFEEGVKIGKIKLINPSNEYIDSILEMIDVESIRNRNLKIVVDTMYGVSKNTLQTILITSRCDVSIINDRHDTLFGGKLPAPNAETLTKLKSIMKERKANLGIATDGDADRLGIISESGAFVHPNEIMAILYYYLRKYKGWNGAIVRNIATTHLLDRIAESFGEKCYEVPVGFKYISSKMEETDALIGGESSGGLTIRGHIKGKDGIFAASILVEAISVTGKSIDELLETIHEEYGNCYFKEADYRFSEEKKAQLINTLFVKKELPEMPFEVLKISYMDGLKVYFKNGGWVSVRFSGTEPLLRIFSEMDREEDAVEIRKVYERFLKL